MGTFSEAQTYLYALVESKYDIILTLAEKVFLRKGLTYAQEGLFNRELDGILGGSHIAEVEFMWLDHYGISREAYLAFSDMPEFYEYFRRKREECLLL